MTDLEDIWKKVDIGTNIKTLWFNAPKDATKYLEDILEDLSSDISIANEDDEEIDKNELLNLFDDYRKSQEHKLYFRLVKSNINYLVIDIECWELHSDDYDSHADVLTISKYSK